MATSEQTLEFKVFEGPAFLKMPTLIAEGFVPASAAQIMQGRLEGKLSFDECYDSGDTIVYHPDGSVMLVHDSKDLRRLHQRSELHSGALVLPDDTWESLHGKVFSKDEIEKYPCQPQSRERVKEDPFWLWLAHDDRNLLSEYADKMFSCIKSRYDLNEAMSVFISKSPTIDVPALRLWCLGGVDSTAYAYAFSHLDSDYYGRLVGVPKTPGVPDEVIHSPRPSVEEVFADTRDFASGSRWDALAQKIRRRLTQT